MYPLLRRLPTEERFGLGDQMRRAAVSIPSNIAEGFGRESRKDLLKFLRVSRGSLNELMTQYELATSLDLLPTDMATENLLAETDRVLQGLIRSLEPRPH
jgi:four helix bundle protein